MTPPNFETFSEFADLWRKASLDLADMNIRASLITGGASRVGGILASSNPVPADARTAYEQTKTVGENLTQLNLRAASFSDHAARLAQIILAWPGPEDVN